MAESPKTGSDEFGEAVRRARERRGMSRRDLAETTGLSYPYISQIETGYRMPSTPAMRTLADALGLRPDSLFDALRSAPARDTPPGRAPALAPAVPHTAVSGARPSIAPSPVSSPAGGAPPGAAPRAFSATSTDSAAREAGTVGDPGTDDIAAGAPTGAPADLAAGAPADLAAGAPGGWIANRSFRRNPTPPAAAAPAAAPPVTAPPVTAPAAAPNPPATRNRAIDQASALLTALPAAERLPALTEIQARVVRSVVEDEVRRNAVR